MLSKFLLLVGVAIVLHFNSITLSLAQTNRSQCVITKVGSPSGTPPELPAECETSGGGTPGTYRFPLDTGIATGVTTEMAVYPGTYSYKGHVEHAGLDIDTPNETRPKVYAVANGTTIEVQGTESSCKGEVDGCTVRIEHTTGDGYVSLYTHIDPIVENNKPVKKGDIIGYVHDWTGTESLDHLHFELREKATTHNINPRLYFPELQQFPLLDDYKKPTLPAFSASRGIELEPAKPGTEWHRKFLNHPPCKVDPSGCWAH